MNNKQVKWYKSIIIRVNWVIILILIIFISLLSWSINNFAAKELSSQSREVNLEIARALKANVNNFLDNTEEVVYLTASIMEKYLANDEGILNLFEEINDKYPGLEYIYYAENDGKFIIYPQVKMPQKYNIKERSWYQKAVKEEDIIWTNSYLDSNQEKLMITTALPVKNKKGEIKGVLAADILLNELSKRIVNKKIGKTGRAYITNRKGEVIAHPDYDYIQNRYNISGLVDYEKILEMDSGSINFTSNGSKKIASFITLEKLDSIVFAQIDSREAFSVINKLENIIFTVSLLILIILIIIIFLINKKYLLDPIHKLINKVNKFAAGKFDVSFTESRDDEIGKLAKSFNYMTAEIAAVYQKLAKYNKKITDLNKDLEYQANHDPLTDLPNRRLFMKKIKKVLKKGRQGAIVLLDFDNFKEINDSVGHIYGDQLLQKFSSLLSRSFSENVFAARYGGDEFLLLITGPTTEKEIEKYILQLKGLVAEPFLINESEYYLDFSLGISCFPKDSDDGYELITMADTAMYQAKEMHNKDYLFYIPEMFNKIKDKKEIRDLLHYALKNNGFELKYQPQLNIKNNKIECLEALVRLKNYNIRPAEFIPVAEESGLIIEIGRWVTEKAIKDLAILRKENNYSLKVSINFSVQQLNDPKYIDFVAEKLKENNIKGEFLEIEITESFLIRQEKKALKYLKKLKELDLTLALDDFGSGYSSLSYLTYIPFAKVKLDKLLIDKFLGSYNLEAVESLISFFHSLEIPVVAEGVERNKQLIKLTKADCDFIQGYLFSRPLKFKKLKEVLNNKNGS